MKVNDNEYFVIINNDKSKNYSSICIGGKTCYSQGGGGGHLLYHHCYCMCVCVVMLGVSVV